MSGIVVNHNKNAHGLLSRHTIWCYIYLRIIKTPNFLQITSSFRRLADGDSISGRDEGILRTIFIGVIIKYIFRSYQQFAYHTIKECMDGHIRRFSMKERNSAIVYTGVVIGTILLMLICGAYDSPLYPYYTSGDTSIFMLIGKGISEGKVAYVDLFDHKGPILFWLHALGWTIGGRTGVWVIETLGVIACAIAILKICEMLKSNWQIPVIGTALIYLYLFGHGDVSENFSIPYIYISLYFMTRYYVSKKDEHPAVYSLIYGLCFGILAFNRVNNALVICTVALCIVIQLARRKQVKNIFTNFLAGFLGIAIISIPICIYFYSKNALFDMLYGTFIHNFLYAGSKSHVSIFSNLPLYLCLYLPLIFAALTFFENYKTTKSLFSAAMLVATIFCFAELVFTNAYEHYFTPALPVVSVAFAVAFPGWNLRNLISMETLKKNRLVSNCLLLAIFIAYFFLSAYRTAAPIYKCYLTDICYNRYAEVQKAIEVIPEEERDSVVGYEIATSWYVDSSITPCYKYYSMQHWFSSELVNANQEFIQYVKTQHPTWVVAPLNLEEEDLKQVLKEDYTLVSEADYAYYRCQT